MLLSQLLSLQPLEPFDSITATMAYGERSFINATKEESPKDANKQGWVNGEIMSQLGHKEERGKGIVQILVYLNYTTQ